MATERNRRGRPTHNLLNIVIVCVFAGSGFPLVAPCAGAEPTLEYQVKAAFLLNFTKFIEWPPETFSDAGSPFVICVLGKDPFGHVLDQLAEGEKVAGRPLEIRRVSASPLPKACQIIFIGGAEKDHPAVPMGLGPGVLTVGEGESFAHAGGIISFVIDNRRVRFDINQSAAERALLKLSSKLLNVARSVER
jgi:hypothetical protein